MKIDFRKKVQKEKLILLFKKCFFELLVCNLCRPISLYNMTVDEFDNAFSVELKDGRIFFVIRVAG